MPKPTEVVPDEKPEKDTPSSVTVELDDNNQPIAQKEEKKEEPKYVTADQIAAMVAESIKKATAPLYYEMRKSREPQTTPTPQPVTPKPEPTEWDQRLQKDWKGTVEELAEQKAKSIIAQEKELQKQEAEKQRVANLLESNKSDVMKRHPELEEEGSQKQELYRQVLVEHPEYLANPFGPKLAMYDMEERLRQMGVVDNTTKQVVQKEVARQVRTNGAAIPKGTTSTSTKSVTLTKEQKEFCDTNNIKYENYVRMLKRTGQGAE